MCLFIAAFVCTDLHLHSNWLYAPLSLQPPCTSQQQRRRRLHPVFIWSIDDVVVLHRNLLYTGVTRQYTGFARGGMHAPHTPA
jgi:hypothetical protein